MRRTEFDRLLEGEFGGRSAGHVLRTHVLSRWGVSPLEAIDQGRDLREVWWELCRDFEVPEERRLGADL